VEADTREGGQSRGDDGRGGDEGEDDGEYGEAKSKDERGRDGGRGGGEEGRGGGEEGGFGRGVTIVVTERVSRGGGAGPVQDRLVQDRLVLRRRTGVGMGESAAQRGGFDGTDVELSALPGWVVECAWHGQAQGRDQPKLSFILVPGDKRSKNMSRLSRCY
jgi:hypothetical protein